MHPYERIADHYRRLIRDGVLAPGSRLPTVKDAADEHGVATATVRHAYSWMQAEGILVTSPRGTFVADPPRVASSPHDRLDRLRRTRSVLAEGEWMRTLKAELIRRPPLYIAEIFALEPDDQVLAREYVTGSHTTAQVNRRALAVDWYPPYLGALVPELLSTAPKSGDDLITQIRAATGRVPRYGRDAMHARTADAREAAHLGLTPGSEIMAMAYEWSDDEGVIVYGEVCLPPRMDVGYSYRLDMG